MTAVIALRAATAAARLPPGAATVRTRTVVRPALAFLGRWSLRTLVVAAVAAFAVLVAGPHLLGYRTTTAPTTGMAPGIGPGDLVITTPLAVTDVTEGMVISYHVPVGDQRLVTHRVVDVRHGPDGAVTVRTRGDAHDHADPWTAVLQGDTAYRVQAVVPGLGHLVTALGTPALIHGVPAVLAAWLLCTIWRPGSRVDGW